MSNPQSLEAALNSAGISKMVHALVSPETEAAVDQVVLGGDQDAVIRQTLSAYFNRQAAPDPDQLADLLSRNLAAQRESFHAMFRKPWAEQPGSRHDAFFALWHKWTAPVMELDIAQFPHTYPTSGATEGLREMIKSYTTKALQSGERPVIHVFDGEYEGFAAYAKDAGADVVTHDRARWREALEKIGPGEQFYLSQPSAIDGNVWDDFDTFAQALGEKQPSAQLIPDVTYVGCVAKDFHFKADYPNIPAVIFSLSKPAGARHHRVGGMISREERPALFGNKLATNLTALAVGIAFMEHYGVREVPQKYAPLQEEAIEQANAKLGLDLKPSDVYVLATGKPADPPTELEKLFSRGPASDPVLRICVTPAISALIDQGYKPANSPTPPEGPQP